MHRILSVGLTLVMLAAMAASLSACNTTAGAGQDISATGKVITKGADQLKP